MGYDDRNGSEGWRERDSGRPNRDTDRGYSEERGSGRGWDEGRREAMGWGPGDRDRGRGRDSGGGGGEDRGFFERAADTARSWLGGDEDDHRGHGGRGGERYERSHRDNGHQDRGAGTLGGGGGFGGGWGNQAGESWNNERPGRPGWFTDSVGGERGHRPGAGDPGHYGARGGQPREQGRSGYGNEPWGGGDREQARGGGASAPSYTPMTGDYGRGGIGHDPHYSEWRRRQMEELDREYDEYRREHQSKFENEFGSWRSRRQDQRQMMGKVSEHMEVLGSDGSHLGTVDKVRGDRIILTRTDPNAGGIHHSVPCSWVENVADKVTLNRSAEQAMTEWRDEDRNRALFEGPNAGSEGPHVLNRSFSGTYSDDDKRRDD
jgi:hypothetical protein